MLNKSLLVLTLVIFSLAELVRSERINHFEVSEELCRRLENGNSKIFFRIFCSKPDSGVVPPPSNRLSKFSSEICERLCEEGNGGAVCNCSGGMPPAVGPPPPPPSQKVEPKKEEIRKKKNVLKNFPLPPQWRHWLETNKFLIKIEKL